MKVLVLDVGGSNVKMLASDVQEPVSFESGPDLTPAKMVGHVRKGTKGWEYDVVSVGLPCIIGPGGPEAEPGNLGNGWVGFDFEQAFGKPTRVVNDAAMQALGGYEQGRMLFLGLGTGLGSALVTERVVIPLELGGLRYGPGELFFDRLGKAGLEKFGFEAWVATLHEITEELLAAFRADEILLGGGNVERLETLPPNCRRGGNQDAFTGGFRLWDEWVEVHKEHTEPVRTWRVVR